MVMVKSVPASVVWFRSARNGRCLGRIQLTAVNTSVSRELHNVALSFDDSECIVFGFPYAAVVRCVTRAPIGGLWIPSDTLCLLLRALVTHDSHE